MAGWDFRTQDLLGPTYQAMGNLVPNALNSYKQGLGLFRDQQRVGKLAELAQQGDVSPQQMGQALLSIGDVQGALAAARLADSQQNRTFQQGMAERQFGFQQQEAQRAQSNADRGFGLQQQQFNQNVGQQKESNRFRDLQFNFQQQQAGQQQANTDRSFKLQERAAGEKQYPSGYQANPQGGMQFIPGGPADPNVIKAQREAQGKAEGKPLSDKAITNLGEVGSNLSGATRFGGTFKDEYGGWRSALVGDMANKAARFAGIGNEQAATWWQDYDRHKNQVRNQLFGSALTKTEAEAFEKADINPGMTPAAIKRNLELQKNLAVVAAKKLAGVYNAQGKSQEEIEAAIGMPFSEIGITPKKPPAQPQTAPQQTAPAETWADGQYQYRRLPDGRVQRKAIQP